EYVLVAVPAGWVASAALARAEDREVHPGGLQQLGGGLGGRPRAFVERRGAAHPVQVLGRGLPRLEHADPERPRPVRSLGLRLAPRVRRALDVAQHRLRLCGEARIHHHEVATEVHYLVDVLDRHRAGLHAGAAGNAVPDHLVGHRIWNEWRVLGRQQLVAQPHHHELGREQLAGYPGGTDILAAARRDRTDAPARPTPATTLAANRSARGRCGTRARG